MSLKRAFGASVVVAILACVWVASPALGEEMTPIEHASPRPQSVSQYSEIFDVSPETARKRLSIQLRGARIVESLRSALRDDFGGVWFENADGRFKVAAPPGSDRTVVQSIGNKQGLAGEFDVIPVRWRWAELLEFQEVLDEAISAHIRDGTMATAVDPEANSVKVDVADAAAAKLTRLISANSKLSEIPLRVQISEERDLKLDPSACGFPNCDRPLRGGVENLGPSSKCTNGFLALASGVKYILTAGHCGLVGQNFSSRHHSSGAIWPIGPITGRYYDVNGDAAKIRVHSQSKWNMTGWMPLVSAWLNPDHEYDIWGRAWSYQGQFGCHLGSTTAQVCGNVTALNKTLTYSDGTLHSGMTETNACGNSGDSGGPWVSDYFAYGLWSAAYTCGTGNMGVYEEVLDAEARLGVRVATAG